MRFAREGRSRGPLSGLARRRHAAGRHRARGVAVDFTFVAVGVLLPLGLWLLLGSQPIAREQPAVSRRLRPVGYHGFAILSALRIARVAGERLSVMKWMPGTPSRSSSAHCSVA
jgi:hypothetical protein